MQGIHGTSQGKSKIEVTLVNTLCLSFGQWRFLKMFSKITKSIGYRKYLNWKNTRRKIAPCTTTRNNRPTYNVNLSFKVIYKGYNGTTSNFISIN